MQGDIDNRHRDLYNEAVELANEINIQQSMPRITQRQFHRANAPGQTPEHYYRINLTTVFLDHALQQLNTRFQDKVYVCYKGLSVLPTNVIDHPTTWKEDVKIFCQNYYQDIPNNAGLEPELVMWERKWEDHFVSQRNACLPDRVSIKLQATDKVAFPNIYAILQVLATIPITSASCERSISTLRNLKNYLRNTMSEDRLNGLALMYAYRNMDLQLDPIIDLFANLNQRRMRMTNILEDEGN